MKTDSAKYVIIGNSTAAIGCIEGIRSVDPDRSVILVAKEPCHTYSRPLISYFLAGEIDAERMHYRPRDFYDANRVDARLGLAATRVDPEQKIVETTNGSLHFEKLLIASGGRPFVPDIPGIEASGVFTFTSWNDATVIGEYIEGNRAKRAVVVGGGLIGIKAAEALRARGLDVLVVELAGRLLPLALDAEGSRMAEESLRAAGVELECSTTVNRVLTEDGCVSGVLQGNDRTASCNLVIVAAGVVPATGLVAGSGIGVDKGILIDEGCRTSVEGIFAAGDVAQGCDALSGESRPIPIFPNAYHQGRVAGVNMAGGDASTNGTFSMNSVEVFGLPTVSVGLATASGDGYEELVHDDEASGTYRRVVLRGDRIVGALFVGDIDRAGIFTGLMRQGIDISSFKDLLLTEEFGLISLPEEYRKHVVMGEAIEV